MGTLLLTRFHYSFISLMCSILPCQKTKLKLFFNFNIFYVSGCMQWCYAGLIHVAHDAVLGVE